MIYAKIRKTMKRNYKYEQPPPQRRPLKVYAFDPMIARRQGGRITIDIPNETDLLPGPKGKRISVIDYDGANDVFYSPIDLDHSSILMQNGLDPTESDPRFHQQMVYAVAMKVLENFDIALGRKIKFRPRPGQPELRLFPHAFHGENAFYDPSMKAILFGYFRADETNPGPNLPGQYVFTCLSQDIIVHEMTHAIVDRLRYHFREPSNRDVAAFHEGFADIVAIFQHFTFPDILRAHIRETRGDLRSPNNLIMLASEFGYATGSGQALRSALDPPKKGEKDQKGGTADPSLYKTVLEPHERGSILVAAVFDAFFKTYQSRIADLIRIATGGTGKLPEGDLHPDLVNRIAAEASRTAQSVLNMCIRAFEYLPPIDITFGDYLRALVTADFELSPADESGLRANMIEAFRARGIYPENVSSLAEDSLLWEGNPDLPPLPISDDPDAVVQGGPEQLCLSAYWLDSILSNAYEASTEIGDEYVTIIKKTGGRNEKAEAANEPAFESGQNSEDEESDISDAIVKVLQDYASKYADKLNLDPNRPTHIAGFHPVFRVNPRGQLLVEIVVQFTQLDKAFKENTEISGGLNLRGGTTLIASANGAVRYVISKPLESADLPEEINRQAAARRQRQIDFVRELDSVDTNLTWNGKKYYNDRILKSINFKAVHGTIGK